jgi:hypothetical protein
MAEQKLLGIEDMEAIDSRLAKMGRELYQLIEDYPVLDRPGWGYVPSLMFLHQQVYDEAMKLKRASIAAEPPSPSVKAAKNFNVASPKVNRQLKKAALV